MAYKLYFTVFCMPEYSSSWWIPFEEKNTDEAVMGYVSEIYKAGDRLGMDSEFTEVEVDGFDEDLEYFGASAIEYGDELGDMIDRVVMELEFPEGYLEASYSRTPAPRFQVEFYGDREAAEFLEDEIGENFSRSFRDRAKSAARYTVNKFISSL